MSPSLILKGIRAIIVRIDSTPAQNTRDSAHNISIMFHNYSIAIMWLAEIILFVQNYETDEHSRDSKSEIEEWLTSGDWKGGRG